MKKTFYNPGSRYSGLTIRKTFVGILALACILSAFTFTSCSDESGEMDSSSLTENADLELTQAPNLDEFIHLVGKSGDNENLASKRATSAAGNDRGRFNIAFKFVEPPTDRQREVFEAAAARWERIIIKDVPSFTPTIEGGGPLPSFFSEEPLVNVGETLDDIIIEVLLAPIDGPGRILGRAGPRFVRTDDFLTISGIMQFDSDDLGFLDELDLFEEVIIHEMGHVLGVGTLWNVAPFGFPRTLLEGTVENPYFNGKMANVHWNAEGGTGELPVEGIQEGPGTRFSHWDEDILKNELMTGFLNLGENPLSRITAGSLRDLGYGTAVKGESYDLPKGTSGIDISSSSAGGNEQGLNIAQMEELLLPIGFVTIEK
jgi:hypothetical protein